MIVTMSAVTVCGSSQDVTTGPASSGSATPAAPDVADVAAASGPQVSEAAAEGVAALDCASGTASGMTTTETPPAPGEQREPAAVVAEALRAKQVMPEAAGAVEVPRASTARAVGRPVGGHPAAPPSVPRPPGPAAGEVPPAGGGRWPGCRRVGRGRRGRRHRRAGDARRRRRLPGRPARGSGRRVGAGPRLLEPGTAVGVLGRGDGDRGARVTRRRGLVGLAAAVLTLSVLAGCGPVTHTWQSSSIHFMYGPSLPGGGYRDRAREASGNWAGVGLPPRTFSSNAGPWTGDPCVNRTRGLLQRHPPAPDRRGRPHARRHPRLHPDRPGHRGQRRHRDRRVGGLVGVELDGHLAQHHGPRVGGDARDGPRLGLVRRPSVRRACLAGPRRHTMCADLPRGTTGQRSPEVGDRNPVALAYGGPLA